MKVTIDAAGRRVEVECADANTSPREVLDGTRPSGGPAFGLVSASHAGRQVSPMNMGGYGRAGVDEVRA